MNPSQVALNSTRKPELLAPVASMEMAMAAVHNGADAIYVGAPHWNARGRTPDLSLEQLAEMISFCRLRGVKVFLAMNVLVFEREMQEIAELLHDLLALRPDAFIVQDIGLVRLIKAMCPSQEVHASTQMTIASPEAIAATASLGISRWVLARELPLDGIRQTASSGADVEVFVHGALCVSYSGQCLTSESFGGRSANRGQCAQSCRLPYRLFVDGQERDMQGRHYLFSPQDLCGLDQVAELAKAGVASLKIEGRLKSPEYVAAVTAAYRHVLDTGTCTSQDKEALESLFSRGLFTGWLGGVDHQKLVNGWFSDHHGMYLGTVDAISANAIRIVSDLSASAGDGLVFGSNETTIGGRIYHCREIPAQGNRPRMLELEFARDFPLRSIAKGDQVYRNDSPHLEQNARLSYTDRSRHKRIPVTILLEGDCGAPLALTMQDQQGHSVRVESPVPLEAKRSNVDAASEIEWMQSEMSALGGTVYSAIDCIIKVAPNAFVHRKMLRELRQQATQLLDQQRLLVKGDEIAKPSQLPVPRFQSRSSNSTQSNGITPTNLLHVVVRRENQIEALQGLPIDCITMEFDYGRSYREGMESIRSMGYSAGIATLRVHKPGENHHLRVIRELWPDRVLVRSLGALQVLADAGLSLHGDFSLNACNGWTAEWLLDKGLVTLHPSLDLNKEQLLDLARNFGGAPLEVSLHHYMPTFHMEHCVFAAFLSNGTSFKDCGKPCEKHFVEVQDHKGERHILQSDQECRNTMFRGSPQSAAKLFPELRELGLRHFRLELLDETPQQARRKVQLYTQLLAESKNAEVLHKELGLQERYGITEGQVFQQTQWKDRKKE